jgi:hypothetical protein
MDEKVKAPEKQSQAAAKEEYEAPQRHPGADSL